MSSHLWRYCNKLASILFLEFMTLKDIFNQMKKLGFYKEYESYEDYHLKKYGETPNFKETLSEPEQKQFEEMFGEKNYDELPDNN